MFSFLSDLQEPRHGVQYSPLIGQFSGEDFCLLFQASLVF